MSEFERNDDDLRTLFHEVRAADAGRAPGFERTMSVRRRPPRALRLVWVPATLAIAVVLVVVGTRLAQRPETTFTIDAGLTALRAPTDFLLDVAGAEFLRSVPRLGPGISFSPGLVGRPKAADTGGDRS